MRPVLLELGPWSLAALPVVYFVVAGIMLLWQALEHRYGAAPPLNWRRALLTLLPAAALTVLLWWAVNRIAPLQIKAYGTMLVVAFTAGSLYVILWGDRKILRPAEVLDIALYCLLGCIIGARVIFAILDWNLYAANPASLLNVWEGGLSFHGGVLGAVSALYLFCRRRGKSFWRVLDQTAPALALGYAFARIGCFLNGCCHGHACSLPWAMNFPHGELPSELVHPTQLYAVLMTLVIFAVLVRLQGKLPRPGHLWAVYLALYSLGRFLLEYTRSGATAKILPGALGLTVGQVASLIIMLAMVITLAATWKTSPATPERPPHERRPS